MKHQTSDLRIADMNDVSPPEDVLQEHPLTEDAARTVYEARERIRSQFCRNRMIACWRSWGPCSIHDIEAAHEYAQRLQAVRDRLAEGPDDRDAGVFRETAYHGGLEGPDQ